MCAYGTCQIGIPTTGEISAIKKGETGFIALHLFPKNTTGVGNVVIELIDINSSKSRATIKFIIEVTSVQNKK